MSKGYRIFLTDEDRRNADRAEDFAIRAQDCLRDIAEAARCRNNSGLTEEAFEDLCDKLDEVIEALEQYADEAHDWEPESESVADPVATDLAYLAAQSLKWGAM